MADAYQRVRRHTKPAGTGSHVETDPDGARRTISYQLFDCKYCDEENIVTSKAGFDTWSEALTPLQTHLESEHPEQL
jgi:hypothetical protein